VRLHEPVLPVVGPEQPLDRLDTGDGVPALEELRLHRGTVWRWNRAIYDPAGGGHLRIEMRALPAGPSVTDMLANAAFLLGLTLALVPGAAAMTRRFAFQQAHHNFYRAAQFGLAAELAWPLEPGGRPRTVAAPDLVRHLLPAARQGLEDAGVFPEEAGELLAAIEHPRIPAPTTTTSAAVVTVVTPWARCGVGGEGLDVVGPLEGGRVRDRPLAEQAPELADGLEAVAVHPVAHPGLNRAQVAGAVAQQGRGQHGHIRPGQQHLEHVGGPVDPGHVGHRAERGAELDGQRQPGRPPDGAPVRPRSPGAKVPCGTGRSAHDRAPPAWEPVPGERQGAVRGRKGGGSRHG
jgi:hypothetical protein